MYRTVYQKGCFSVFYSVGGRPLSNWSIHTQNGYIKRVLDDDIKSMVLEILGSNVSTTFITCPREPKQELAIKLPFLVLLVKNMHKYFTFEVQILDDQNFFRRFKVSNFQSKTSVKPFCTSMPMGMSAGWNQIHFNLADFTRRAYGTNYMETVRLQIHANVRIRRIYFTDRLYHEDELPNEYRLIQKPKTKRSINWGVPAARPPSPLSQPLKEGKKQPAKKSSDKPEEPAATTSPLLQPEKPVEEGSGPSASPLPQPQEPIEEGSVPSASPSPQQQEPIEDDAVPSASPLPQPQQPIEEGSVPSASPSPQQQEPIEDDAVPSASSLPQPQQPIEEGSVPSASSLPQPQQSIQEGVVPSTSSLPQPEEPIGEDGAPSAPSQPQDRIEEGDVPNASPSQEIPEENSA